MMNIYWVVVIINQYPGHYIDTHHQKKNQIIAKPNHESQLMNSIDTVLKFCPLFVDSLLTLYKRPQRFNSQVALVGCHMIVIWPLSDHSGLSTGHWVTLSLDVKLNLLTMLVDVCASYNKYY